MKKRERLTLGVEDLKNMRFPFVTRVIVYSSIPAIIILFLLMVYSLDETFGNSEWIPILVAIQTAVIVLQLVIIWKQTKYAKMPYLPEFDIESYYVRKPIKQKKPGYYIMLENNGDVAYRVDCKIKIGKKEKLLQSTFYEKIPRNGKEKILEYVEKNEFINQPIRIYFSYFDKANNHLYSRWFKMKDKEDFIVILSGLDQ